MIRPGSRILSCVLSAGLLAAPATADTVKLHRKPPFDNVRISTFKDGRIIFRGVSQQFLRKPLAEVEWIALDGAPELGPAERARSAGEWSRAIIGYRAALEQVVEPGLADYVRLRLLSALEQGDRFDEAVQLFTDLLGRRIAGVAVPAPRRPGPPGSEANQRAMQFLRRMVRESQAERLQTVCRQMLFELVLFEDVEPPTELTGLSEQGSGGGGSARETASAGQAATPGRTRLLGLPTAGRAPTRPELPRLPVDSLVRGAVERALDGGDWARAERLLSRGWPHLPADESEVERWRLLRARSQIERGDAATAANDLLVLSETSADTDLAARAVYYLAVAHERLGRADVARRLYGELTGRETAPEELRAAAGRALERLRPPASAP